MDAAQWAGIFVGAGVTIILFALGQLLGSLRRFRADQDRIHDAIFARIDQRAGEIVELLERVAGIEAIVLRDLGRWVEPDPGRRATTARRRREPPSTLDP